MFYAHQTFIVQDKAIRQLVSMAWGFPLQEALQRVLVIAQLVGSLFPRLLLVKSAHKMPTAPRGR